jgi:ubiquitin C-terminal hydrolase
MRASIGGPQDTRRPHGQYELAGILKHSGKTGNSGHYFFSGSRDAHGGWYNFNDQEVTRVGNEHIEDERVMQTAYGLLYRFRN